MSRRIKDVGDIRQLMIERHKHMRYTNFEGILKGGLMERFSHQTQPAPQRAQQPGGTPAPASAPVTHKKSNKPSFASKFLVIVLIVAALAITAALAAATFGGLSTSKAVNSDQYQAVFLDNGQVYFGKLSNLNSDYVQLNDIYYLQVDQQVQPDQGDQTAPQQKISLAKLGNELHGPEDLMYINADKIVFWENMKTDGQVTTAITEYQTNPPSDQQTQDSTPATETPATP